MRHGDEDLDEVAIWAEPGDGHAPLGMSPLSERRLLCFVVFDPSGLRAARCREAVSGTWAWRHASKANPGGSKDWSFGRHACD